eukprot:scpid110528/ scgid21199/ 
MATQAMLLNPAQNVLNTTRAGPEDPGSNGTGLKSVANQSLINLCTQGGYAVSPMQFIHSSSIALSRGHRFPDTQLCYGQISCTTKQKGCRTTTHPHTHNTRSHTHNTQQCSEESNIPTQPVVGL